MVGYRTRQTSHHFCLHCRPSHPDFSQGRGIQLWSINARCYARFREIPLILPRGKLRSILREVNMSNADQRILELQEQVSNLLRIKRELEEKVEELTPRRIFKATLTPNKSLFWVEA